MSGWTKVATLNELSTETGLEVTVGDVILALFLVDGTVHAIDGMCAHAGGPLGQGQLSGCIVTCPWHGWQYDVTSGQHCLSEPIRQTSYPAKIDGDDVYVELP